MTQWTAWKRHIPLSGGKTNWSPGIAGFLLGAGVGVGLGILFAPAASNAAGKLREAVAMPFTGTEG
jgi:hypothetical protein